MRSLNIAIVGGCGHVGLPLGLVLSEVPGFRVTLLDIDSSKVSRVNSGDMPFLERNAPEILKRVIGKTLQATTSEDVLQTADVAIAVVGTPVDRHMNPTVNELYRSVDRLLEVLPAKALLILRSTVFPGVTRLVYERIKAVGKDIRLAFCPERIAEGNAIEELQRLPQLISAFESDALEAAREVFQPISPDLIELEPLEAELAKLFTNSWRYLNFAISNQFYALANSYDLDFYRIHDAVTRDYPRMRSFASAGFAAGPCLLKDTLQLAAFSNNNFFLGHAAMLVNEGLPNCIVRELQKKCNLRDSRIGILGMAYKAESDDLRESLSYKLKHLLEVEAREVLCTDPYVDDKSLVPLDKLLATSDAVVLGVPHRCYREMKIPTTMPYVDIWGVWRKQ